MEDLILLMAKLDSGRLSLFGHKKAMMILHRV